MNCDKNVNVSMSVNVRAFARIVARKSYAFQLDQLFVVQNHVATIRHILNLRRHVFNLR
jgi:hypothetical protein